MHVRARPLSVIRQCLGGSDGHQERAARRRLPCPVQTPPASGLVVGHEDDVDAVIGPSATIGEQCRTSALVEPVSDTHRRVGESVLG